MNCIHRKNTILFTLSVLVILIAIPACLTWRAVRQERLNRDLIAAIKQDDIAAVISLLKQGASPEAHDHADQSTPIWQILVARIRAKTSEAEARPSALMVAMDWIFRAADYRHVSPPAKFAIIKALIEHGARVNFRYKGGATPLMLAVLCNKRDIIQILLDHGADVHLEDNYCYPILWQFPARSDFATMDLLISHGADINARYYDGQTLLINAVQAGNTALVLYLLSRHADVTCAWHSLTALSIAQYQEYVEIVHLLKQAGAKE